jgi:plasmid stabilization system protein ParE
VGTSRVRFHRLASLEYGHAFAWYFVRSPMAAARFEHEVERALQVIAESPHVCPLITSRHRRAVLHPFPYSIVFLEMGLEQVVVAVAHAKRRFGYWRRRRA